MSLLGVSQVALVVVEVVALHRVLVLTPAALEIPHQPRHLRVIMAELGQQTV
jgi:hypothetical protein